MNELSKRPARLSEEEEILQLPFFQSSDEKPPEHYYNPNFGGYPEEKLKLRDYLRIIRRYIWLILGFTILITLIAAIYMARQPDIYEARARVQVDLENVGAKSGSTDKGLLILNNNGTDPTYFNTQLQILKGEALQRRVVKTLDLAHNPDFFKVQADKQSILNRLMKMVGMDNMENPDLSVNKTDKSIPISTTDGNIAEISSKEDLEEAEKLAPFVSNIKNSLTIDPVRENSLPNKETRLIEIRFVHSDPKAAVKVVNTIADTFVLSNMEHRVENNVSTGEFLVKRVAELQIQIRGGEERLINYAKNNEIISLDASQNTVVDRLVGLNKQLLDAENDRKMAEAAYRAASAPNAAESISEADDKNDYQSKIADLKQHRAQLLVDYTEKYPEVIQLDSQIKILENQLKETRERATNIVKTNLETKYKGAAARENSIRDAFNKQKEDTLSQNAAAVNYRIIQQEIETNKNLLTSLLQQAKENDVIKAQSSNNISVIEYSIPPRTPIGPKRFFVIGIAFVLSLFISVCLAMLLEFLNDTIKTSDDIEKYLHLPTLALIPSINQTGRRSLFFFKKPTALLGANQSDLLINQSSQSPLSEAYRQLRTSILLSTANHPPKTILITSSLPAEGKTTTSINIALSLAQTGVKVLIIDGDMRRPQIHKKFGISNGSGLSTILSQNLSEEALLALIQKDEESGINLLPSGVIPPNPAELIGSDQMRKALNIFEKRFDFIIVDSPPVATCTDGIIISSLTEGTILVIKAGKTPGEIVRRSQQKFHEINAKLLGVVLNRVEKNSGEYYYTYYKNYYTNDEEESSQNMIDA